MKRPSFLKLFMYFTLCCTLVFAFGLMAGCKGSDGSNGANGTNGQDLQTGTVDARTLTFDDLRNIPLDGQITSVNLSGNQPVVAFKVINKNTGEGIANLRTFSLHIAQLKPELNGSNSYWMNYIMSSSSTTANTGYGFRPTTDLVSQYNNNTGAQTYQGYTVQDNLDGSYVVTFGANIKSGATFTYVSNQTTGALTYMNPASVAYDATLPHRIVVGVRSVVTPGVVGKTAGAYAGPLNPITNAAIGQFTNTNGVNLFYDFTPSTGAVISPFARDIVTIGACNQCHYKIQYGFPRGNNTSGHFGSRTDTKTCVMCHTPQNVLSGQPTTNADFTPFIHKIHMGERLPNIETGLTGTFNDVTYPQDIRNCTQCHNGALSDNWKSKPTRKACGACHNDVNFATGAGHGPSNVGGAQADDSGCLTCHGLTSSNGVAQKHIPVATPDPTDPRMGLGGTNTHTNSEFIAAAGAVPAGAHKINWVVSSVTVSNGNPQIKFKFQSDGVDMVFSTPTSTLSELFATGFSGSPSAYWVWAEPQDGITKPADFNKSASSYIKNVWNGLVTSNTSTTDDAIMTGPDGSGFYLLTKTSTTIPATAVMITGGIGYSYGSGSPPFVQTDLATYPLLGSGMTTSGGLAVPAPNVWKVASGVTGNFGRRVIVDTNKCNACHDGLGVEPTFHVGQRNDAPTCSFCHNPGRSSQGWAVNANTFVHAIHGASKRTVNFTWDGTRSTPTGDEPDDGFFNITYSGLLKNCEMCHVAGGYDFSGSMYTNNNAAQDPANMLLTTAASGTLLSSDTTSFDFSPYVAVDTPYGSAGASTNLVNSPFTAACFACHDTLDDRSHFALMGGSTYDTRAVALTKNETCIICHGPAANTAFGDFVPAIKSVHRWW